MYRTIFHLGCLAVLAIPSVRCQQSTEITSSLESTTQETSSAVQQSSVSSSEISAVTSAPPAVTSVVSNPSSALGDSTTAVEALPSSSPSSPSPSPSPSSSSSVMASSVDTSPATSSVMVEQSTESPTLSTTSLTSSMTDQTTHMSLTSSMADQTTPTMSASETVVASRSPTTAIPSVTVSTAPTSSGSGSASAMPPTSVSATPTQSESESMDATSSSVSSPPSSDTPTTLKPTQKPPTPTKKPVKEAEDKGAIKVEVAEYSESKFKQAIVNVAKEYCNKQENQCDASSITEDKIVIVKLEGAGKSKTVQFYIEGDTMNDVAIYKNELAALIESSAEKLKSELGAVTVVAAQTQDQNQNGEPLEGWVIAVIATGCFLLLLIALTVINALRTRKAKKKEGFEMSPNFKLGPSELPQYGMQGPDEDESDNMNTNTSTFNGTGQGVSTVNEVAGDQRNLVDGPKTDGSQPGGISNRGFSEERTSL